MSTFPGLLQEIPEISVDRFDGWNLRSEIFFLSHFHADHMVGLYNADFRAKLQRNESSFIYCSELTALFLSQNHLKGLDEKIRVLPVNKEHVIRINNKYGFVSVTPLSAGHCPGSVMFLFTYKGLNYLYTGDYRMTKENIIKIKALKDLNGGLKPIETLYLDTTFFHPVYSYLPNRDESMAQLIEQCRSWLQKGCDYVVDLRTPATIGVEYVLIALSNEFGQPFHVTDKAYEKYSRIPELSSSVTKDANSPLHACISGFNPVGKPVFLKHHKAWKEHNIFSVKLCSLHASRFSKEKSLISYSPTSGLHRLVYSSHSSHGELLEMIDTLQPKKIVPCVVPKDYTSEQVVDALQSSARFEVEGSCDSPLQFSPSEEVAGTNSFPKEDVDSQKERPKSEALFTLSKYNVKESSDEEEGWKDGSDEDELPPFRWDCYYDASKASGLQKRKGLPLKRQKLDNS